MNYKPIEKPVKNRHAALDWGMAFAFSHYKELLLCMLLPLLADLVAVALLYETLISARSRFLAYLLVHFFKAWMLTSVGMMAIEASRGKDIKLLEIWYNALQNLPKIFIGSWLIMSIVLMALFFPPSLILVVFVFWAPIFCIGECYAKQDLPEPELMDEEDIVEDLPPGGLFEFKGIFELGFVRSVQFSVQHFRLSLQIVLLLLCASIIPQAGAMFLFGGSQSLLSGFMQSLIVYPVGVFFVGVWVASFFAALPKSAQLEVGIKASLDRTTVAALERFKPFLLAEKRAPFIALSVLGLVAFAVLEDFARKQHQFPPHAELSIERAVVEEGQLNLELSILDAKNRFSWFHRDRLKVVFAKSGEFEDTDEILELDAVGLKRSIVSNEEGDKLGRGKAYPNKGPLHINLFYPLSSSIPASGEYALLYALGEGRAQILYKDVFPRGW